MLYHWAKGALNWGERRDSNPRHSVPQTDALTNWATITIIGIRCRSRTHANWVGTSRATVTLSVHEIGAPKRIRTFDLRFRRPTLYPAELWVHDIWWTLRDSNPRHPVSKTGALSGWTTDPWNGAACRIWTRHLRFTKPLLYQMS